MISWLKENKDEPWMPHHEAQMDVYSEPLKEVEIKILGELVNKTLEDNSNNPHGGLVTTCVVYSRIISKLRYMYLEAKEKQE